MPTPSPTLSAPAETCHAQRSHEAAVAHALAAAVIDLQTALQAATLAGYGGQLRDSIDHAIDQVEMTRRMLS